MIKFSTFLAERYINLHTPEEKAKHVDKVWDMLHKSYEKIGGFKSAGSKEELIKDSSIWKLYKKNGQIRTAAIYKDKHGRKSIAKATDGTQYGKDGVYKITGEDMKRKRAWAEVSGAMEHIALKMGGKYVDNKHASKLTGKEILHHHDNGVHYDRMIAGHKHTKAIVGFYHLDKNG